MKMPQKNKHVGDNIGDYIRTRMADDKELAIGVAEEFDKLKTARKIKRLRQRKRLNQAELAKLAGMKQPAIARMESGTSIPRLDLLYRVASAMGMRLDVRFVKIGGPTRSDAPRARASARQAKSHVR